MNKEQWNEIRDGILQFNRLVTTPEERKTEAYILKCYDLLDEENEETLDAYIEVLGNRKGTIEHLDGLCDILVTGTQLVDALTPSQLEWGYVEPFLRYSGSTFKLRNEWLDYIVTAIRNADLWKYDLYGAMLEVNRSNMSKIAPLSYVQELHGDNVDEAMKAHSDWIETHRLDSEGNQRYNGVFGTVVQDSDGCMRVVFRDENKKVMKSIWFQEPNLAPYLGG